jgi:uncharacterized protein (TIGR02271 family)
MLNVQDVASRRGQKLIDVDGNKIGTIEEIYLDDQTNQPEWATVNTGVFGSRTSFAPLAQAQLDDQGLRVPYAKDKVKDAPNVDADGRLTQDEEAELYRYYELHYSEAPSDTGLPTGGTERPHGQVGGPGHDTNAANTDSAMTRSEEQLSVGTRQHEAGKVRLRKYVETEPVSETVQVRHEQARVEREPITDANRDAATSGPAFNDGEEHEVALMAEEPVVEKREVPVERVRLDKETVTEQQQVSDEIRKERIDVEKGR